METQRRRGRPKGAKAKNIAGELTRENLVRTALELFSQKGYSGVSIGDVSTESGVAKGSITHHFSDKRKLYGAVFDHVSQELLEAVSPAFDERLSIRERLQFMIDGFIRWSEEKPSHVRLISYDLLELPYRQEVPRHWKLGDHLFRIEGLIKEGREQGVVNPAMDTLTVIEMIIGTMTFHVVSEPYSDFVTEHHNMPERRNFADQVRNMLIRSVFEDPESN